jgi:hypothetical protein
MFQRVSGIQRELLYVFMDLTAISVISINIWICTRNIATDLGNMCPSAPRAYSTLSALVSIAEPDLIYEVRYGCSCA